MKTKAMALYEKRGKTAKYRRRNPVSAHTPVTIPAGILLAAVATPFIASFLSAALTSKDDKDAMPSMYKNVALISGLAAIGGGAAAMKADSAVARNYGKAVAVGGAFGVIWSVIGLVATR